MNVGIHFGVWGDTYTESSIIDHVLRAKSIGASVFEIGIPSFVFNKNEPQINELTDAVKDIGIKILFTTLYPENADMCSEEPASRQRAVSFMRDAIIGARKCNVDTISCIAYGLWPQRYDSDMITPEIKRTRTLRSAETMREIMKYAEDNGVNINCEIVNRFEGFIMNTVDEGLQYCDMVESKNCKLLLDTFHMNIEEDDICDAIRKAGSKNKIGHFHVSEPTRKIPYHSSRISWREIGQALKDVKYNKSIVLEPFLLFEGGSTYLTRLWRDLIPDKSQETRNRMLGEGICFINKEFEI